MSNPNQNPVTIINQEESSIPVIAGVFGGSRGNLPAPYCSFRPENTEDKARLYRAMTNPDCKISDCINMVIQLVDVFVEWVQLVDQKTGEYNVIPRCVLFDADGKTYAATSRGIANALERLTMVYGMPHWSEPISVKIRQVQMNERRFYTLDIA